MTISIGQHIGVANTAQTDKRLTGLFFPRSASLDLSTHIFTQHKPLWASPGLSGPLCASLCLSEALWASLGLSGPLWDFPGLSGPLWAYLKDSWSPKGAQGPQVARHKRLLNTRQLEPQCPSRPEIDRHKNQTIPDSWSPSVLRGFLGPASQPASPPASQPSA